ncbi:tyrosine-sulfated glycopeptide receptor 1-like [Pyrus ussuriensis x Pyrus communis]|uniref:Tyrosine-sulfated glycopeptide receptor 1-like n=1 Tax=Pyrus ussuriensis x Pyrus communis TaxID=2448454 RepID=A0A5N5GJ54_9ROSA|nr:tyrosine-sulfated glycopeptide receptor 1-like [Pyrus ussuriensis x Pyrus communis]
MAYGFLLLLLFSCTILTTNIQACNQTERISLLAFSLTLSSSSVNWSSSVDCCHWNGITCNQEGWVTHLLLPSKGLTGGMFVSSLENLTHLTHLNLSHNSLYGALETKFFLFLKHLEILDLSYNLLSGEMPFSLPQINIQTIDLSSNHFYAWNLTSFNVSNNTFSGHIPSSICLRLPPSIRVLDFSSNEFSGKLSRGFGRCSKLQIIRAGHNNLSGSLPDDIYNATKLEEFALPLNSLNGAIRERIANLTHLTILDFYFNHLSGELPLNFGKLSKLKFMNLDLNSLQGNLPPSLMNCTNLIELHLGFNYFDGDLTTLNFSKLSHLSKLDLIRNNFRKIQPEILSLKSLSFLSLRSVQLTNITGAMKILMRCKSLQTLFLRGSFDHQAMPIDDVMVDFNGFRKLRVLSLANCGFTGQIPRWLSNLKNLEMLDLGFNQITGSIPSWLGTFPKLFHVGLPCNQISGEVPKQLFGLPMLMMNASRADNYEFELPLIGGLIKNPSFMAHRTSNLQGKINLGGNNISGSIPTEIGQLGLLRELYLDNNHFSGNIPDQVSNLKNLEILNLSMNHLSGKIPSSMTSLNFLKEFNVSYNNLVGQIPMGTQLQSFSTSAFEGNPKLCGAPLPNVCKEIGADNKNKVDQDADNEGDEFPWIYIFATLGFIVGFWGVCGYLVLKKT